MSAPVIRGQTGRRIKVLNHHGETGYVIEGVGGFVLGKQAEGGGYVFGKDGVAVVEFGFRVEPELPTIRLRQVKSLPPIVRT